MWLSTIDRDTLNALVIEGECMHLAAELEGKILWASDSFCEYIGYTSFELERITWIRLSVDDANLEADRQAAEEMRQGHRSSYQVEKKYIKKSGEADWGLLHVKRIPASGEFRFAWCSWMPIQKGNALAFAKAIECNKAMEAKLDKVLNEIRMNASRSEEENAVVSVVRVAAKHPRTSLAVAALCASVFGLNAVAELIKTIIGIPTPVKVEQSDNRL